MKMVTRYQAIRSAGRIAYRILGPRFRRLVIQHAGDVAAALASAGLEYLLPSGKNGNSAQSAINLVTPPKGDQFVSKQTKRDFRGVVKNIKFNMRSSAPKWAHGTYQGQMKAKRRVKRKVKYDAVCKDERAVSGTTAQFCMYTIHCTHPPKYVLRMIAMAMLSKYAQQCHVKIRAWTAPCCIQKTFSGGTSAGFTIRAYYQKRIPTSPGTLAGDIQQISLYDDVTTNVSWLDVADGIADKLCQAVDEFSNDIYFSQISFEPTNQSGSNNQQLGLQVWDADDVYIEVKGSSHLQIQNRTLAGGGTDTSSADNINANPLEGKVYTFKGTALRTNFYDLRSGFSTNQIVADGTLGWSQFTSQTTSFAQEMQDAMKQPPNARFFRKVTRVGKVRLEPGAIKKHYLSSSVSLSFNGWMKKMYSYLSSGVTLNGTASTSGTASGAVSKYADLGVGEAALIGLEKVADLGVSNIVTPGERDAVYQSRLWFRRRKFTVATNRQLPATSSENAPALASAVNEEIDIRPGNRPA